MKHFLTLLVAVAICLTAQAQPREQRSLDAENPILLKGGAIHYAGRTITLSQRAIYLDGSLSDEEAAALPHVYNTFQKAAAAFVKGTAEQPMRVYIAPWVYWIDDPDDPYIRGSKGEYPFGMVINCPYLELEGLNPNPRAVVLASARGQTQGAVGNFTMFDLTGDGMRFENLTMGNFCNIDLEYPLKPELGRKKRNTAITQAHVAYCHGDRIVARNVHFLSRLNMCPLAGAKRILFEKCHMESTDDALTSTGLYVGCTLGFYGQKPFYNADRGGAIFLDCDFYVEHEVLRQYFCKAQNPLSVVDCRYHSAGHLYAGWTHTPADWLRGYQYNVTANGQPILIGADKPYNTVAMDREEVLEAYRLEDDKGVFYNTFNLLRGDDDWDPQGVRERVERLSAKAGRDLGAIATALQVEPRVAELTTRGEALKVKASLNRHVNFPLNNRPIKWRVEAGYEKYVKLSATEGNELIITPLNEEDEAVKFMLLAAWGVNWNAINPCLSITFFALAILVMLSLTRVNLNSSANGRQKPSEAMKQRNLVFTVVFFVLAMLISLIPSIYEVIDFVIDWLVTTIKDLIENMKIDNIVNDLGSGSGKPPTPENNEGGADLLTSILNALFLLCGAIILLLCLRAILPIIFRKIRDYWQKLRKGLTSYVSAATEDYIDEVTDLSPSDRDKPKGPRLSAAEERSLPPAERIRYRYRRLKSRHPEWASGSTARENLPDKAAPLYEKARYSTHPITEEDADSFKSNTRRV